MKNLFPVIILSLLTFLSCNFKSETKSLPKNPNTQKTLLPDSLPSISFFDSLGQANSDKLYYWDEKSYQSEKNLSNKYDLNIKVNRQISFNFKDKKYILFPFFRKDKNNSMMLFLHFLLIQERLSLDKLKTISFDNLAEIDAGKALYYYDSEETLLVPRD